MLPLGGRQIRNGGLKFGIFQRFRKNDGEPRAPVILDFIGQREPRDRNGFECSQLPQFLEQVASVTIPQADVADSEIDLFSVRQIQCSLKTVGGVDGVPICPEKS